MSSEIADDTAEAKRQKRLGEFQAWFDGFTLVVRGLQARKKLPVSHGSPGNFAFAAGAAQAVNELYWKTMDGLVRPMVKASNGDPETDIDRFKICSLIELSVVALQPINTRTASSARFLNARLAYHCAVSFIANWHTVSPKVVVKYVGKKIAVNHVTWLTNYDPDEGTPPIFSNAVTWQLIEENYSLRQQIAKMKPA